MPALDDSPSGSTTVAIRRYRLPGIERQGIAQLSLLETALWPLDGGKSADHKFESTYTYPTQTGRNTASVTVRAPLGLQPIDEYVLWGLLGSTLSFPETEPVVLATPYWMLRQLGWGTGGYQYAELRDSLLRLATASYQNTAFFNPLSQEHEYVAFQFLSILLPTVGGLGNRVDNDRSWRVEWNAAFFRFCRATGGTLLFDLDLYRNLTPAARRLFLKLKDRFWRTKRVFMNVDDLTVHGLGFAASRPLFKRKFDLKSCIRELLDRKVIALGPGQTDAEELFIRHGKGSYVVAFYEGEYFRQPASERVLRQKNAISDHPFMEPLRKIGVDGQAIRRLITRCDRWLVERWIRITEAAMHESPRGFPGFAHSPAAFLVDGIQHKRTAPDWFHAHEKRQQYQRSKEDREAAPPPDAESMKAYKTARAFALREYVISSEGQRQYEDAYQAYLALYQRTDPHCANTSAHKASMTRIERVSFRFPEFDDWVLTQHRQQAHSESD